MIFETHAHYEDEAFAQDAEETINKAREAGVTQFVNVGSTMATSRASLEIARSHEDFYAAVGVHPEYGQELTEEALAELREMCADKKTIAIGEIGLDYHWDSCPRDVQAVAFKKQLALAKELHMPVIIHSRDAAEDTFNILRDYAKECERDGVSARGIVHCYGYSAELAAEYIKLGYYIGVGGVLTFKKARKLVETVEKIGLDHLVLETDSPYMSPEPLRGRRNDSSNLVYIVKKVSELLNIPVEEVERVTFENAKKVYLING